MSHRKSHSTAWDVKLSPAVSHRDRCTRRRLSFWPGRCLFAIFEPRSNTAGRKMFEDDYVRAFEGADVVVIVPVFHAKRLPPEARIDREALVGRLASKGRPAFAPDSIDAIPSILRREAKPGDVLILMSSGAFGGLPQSLLNLL